MFLQATQLIRATVSTLESGLFIGHVKRLIIHPDTGQVIACGIQPRGWLSQERFLTVNDILHIEAHALAIRDEDQLTTKEELVRVQDCLARKTPVLGQLAQTQAGKKLGRITDLLIEIETWLVVRYYLGGLFNERILTADRVHLMTPKAVIFLDDLANVTEPVQAETMAVS